MTLPEKILQHVQSLPAPLQAEVLDFVEFLERKTGKQLKETDDAGWSAFSLASAMHGMMDDPVTYSLDDIKEARS